MGRIALLLLLLGTLGLAGRVSKLKEGSHAPKDRVGLKAMHSWRHRGRGRSRRGSRVCWNGVAGAMGPYDVVIVDITIALPATRSTPRSRSLIAAPTMIVRATRLLLVLMRVGAERVGRRRLLLLLLLMWSSCGVGHRGAHLHGSSITKVVVVGGASTITLQLCVEVGIGLL